MASTISTLVSFSWPNLLPTARPLAPCAVRMPGAPISSFAEARPASNAARWAQFPMPVLPSSRLLDIDRSSSPRRSFELTRAPARTPDDILVEAASKVGGASPSQPPVPSVRVGTAVALAEMQTQDQEDGEASRATRRCSPESFDSTKERASCIEDARDGTLRWQREGLYYSG